MQDVREKCSGTLVVYDNIYIMEIPVKILEHANGLTVPKHATLHSAGIDLLAAIDSPCILMPGKRTLVPTGLCIALPTGCEGQIRPRSGLAIKHGITVLNSPGTIDADYRDEIKVILINLGSDEFELTRGMRIAQMVVSQYKTVNLKPCETLDVTDRTGGFGSTGL